MVRILNWYLPGLRRVDISDAAPARPVVPDVPGEDHLQPPGPQPAAQDQQVSPDVSIPANISIADMRSPRYEISKYFTEFTSHANLILSSGPWHQDWEIGLTKWVEYWHLITGWIGRETGICVVLPVDY